MRERTENLQGKYANLLDNQSRRVTDSKGKQIHLELSEYFSWKEQIHVAFMTEVPCRIPERPRNLKEKP